MEPAGRSLSRLLGEWEQNKFRLPCASSEQTWYLDYAQRWGNPRHTAGAELDVMCRPAALPDAQVQYYHTASSRWSAHCYIMHYTMILGIAPSTAIIRQIKRHGTSRVVIVGRTCIYTGFQKVKEKMRSC